MHAERGSARIIPRQVKTKDKDKEMIMKRSSERASLWTPINSALIAALVALVVLPRVGPSMRAQETAATIAVDVKVVTLPVTVRDKHGRIVRDLTKDDFTFRKTAARRPSVIFRRKRIFRSRSDCSSTPAVVKPTSSTRSETQAAVFSIRCSFREKDKAFLIHFDREVELLQDL